MYRPALTSPRDIREELERIARVFEQPLFPGVQLANTPSAPPRPQDGEIRYTNGTWDPGSGQGFYGYWGGAWRFIA